MPRNDVVYRPTKPHAGGGFVVHPNFAVRFASLGIDSALGFLELPGEVVCGHPDRHVVRVVLPGFPVAFFLKRQHRVRWRERFRNWRAGFGWKSRCGREAEILKQLAAAGLPCPRWVARGEDSQGRSFLLVEEIAEARDLRHVLSDNALSQHERRALAEGLGAQVALLHATGFTTPDLTAKHVLVSPDAGDVTLIDWQAAMRVKSVGTRDRLRNLAALHASVVDKLAQPRERLRVLRAALRPARAAGLVRGRFSEIVRRVLAEAERLRERRSIRDQRQPVVMGRKQRLVWVAGEAVCAVPELASQWPKPAVAAPHYGCEPDTLSIPLHDGCATLIRGRSLAPLARLTAALRGRPWRSPGVTLGRVLFHLERYAVPAPRLLAFGQRFVGVAVEWFALHTPPAKVITNLDASTAEQLGRVLRLLHESGCVPLGEPLAVFGYQDGVAIRDVTRIQLVRRVTAHRRVADLRRLLAGLPPEVRDAAETGYAHGYRSNEHNPNRGAVEAPRLMLPVVSR